MRYTLLEMVQLILSAMDSDEVNSISDTVESNQVALLLRSVYYDIATDIALPEHETLIQLDASANTLLPCTMTVPSYVVTLKDVKYDCRKLGAPHADWNQVEYKTFDEFLVWIEFFTKLEDQTDVGVQNIQFNGGTFPFPYRKDKHPQYYTVVDDQRLLFDSFDLSIDTTLQKSKTMCKALTYPDFLLIDNFTPDLDPSQFSFLINRAKTRAFYELKQQINQESAAEARRQKVIVQKKKRKTPDGPELWKTPRYGRS